VLRSEWRDPDVRPRVRDGSSLSGSGRECSHGTGWSPEEAGRRSARRTLAGAAALKHGRSRGSRGEAHQSRGGRVDVDPAHPRSRRRSGPARRSRRSPRPLRLVTPKLRHRVGSRGTTTERDLTDERRCRSRCRCGRGVPRSHGVPGVPGGRSRSSVALSEIRLSFFRFFVFFPF
jgi:hypothetical protein